MTKIFNAKGVEVKLPEVLKWKAAVLTRKLTVDYEAVPCVAISHKGSNLNALQTSEYWIADFIKKFPEFENAKFVLHEVTLIL